MELQTERGRHLIQKGIPIVLGTIVYWLGGLDQSLKFLLALIVIDYLSGVLKAIHQGELSSQIGLQGIAKKIFLLLLVAVAFVVQQCMGESFPLREIVILFFITNECFSILENAGEMGIPLPKKLREALVQLRDVAEKGGDHS